MSKRALMATAAVLMLATAASVADSSTAIGKNAGKVKGRSSLSVETGL